MFSSSLRGLLPDPSKPVECPWNAHKRFHPIGYTSLKYYCELILICLTLMASLAGRCFRSHEGHSRNNLSEPFLFPALAHFQSLNRKLDMRSHCTLFLYLILNPRIPRLGTGSNLPLRAWVISGPCDENILAAGLYPSTQGLDSLPDHAFLFCTPACNRFPHFRWYYQSRLRVGMFRVFDFKYSEKF